MLTLPPPKEIIMTAQTQVLSSIIEVIAEIGKTGVGKDRINTHHKFQFRGIDDIYNALSPLLAKHKICMVPKVLSRECVERSAKDNKIQFHVTVHVAYQLISSIDHSMLQIEVYGEALDSSDKATSKAMSSAYKTAAVQAFCIPIEGNNDADLSSPEVLQTYEMAKLPAISEQECAFLKKQVHDAINVPDLMVLFENIRKRCEDALDETTYELLKAETTAKRAALRKAEQANTIEG
jgi:hypothetical protein